MGQRHAERFADDLGGGGGAEELAASAGRGAGAAEDFGSGFESHLAAGIAGSGGLDLAGVFTFFREQADTAGNQHGGKVAGGGEGHHHGGQSLVAGGDAQDAGAGGQRADEAAEDGGGVVAIGQRIEHAGGALGAAVAGVGAVGGEGDGAVGLELFGGGVHEQADFPVAGVVAESDGRAVGGADSAMGAEDEELLTAERGRVPAHAGVLAQAEEVAGRAVEEHLGGDGEHAGGAGGFAADVVDGGVGGVQDVGRIHKVTISSGRRRWRRLPWRVCRRSA